MSEYQRRIMGLSVSKIDKLYDAEIEYIQTTGAGQCIDLDISPNVLTDAVEMYFQQDVNVTQGRFFSSNEGGGSIEIYINGSKNFAVGLYSGTSWTWQQAYAVNAGTVKRKWKVDYLNKVVTVDDVNVYTITKTLTNRSTTNVRLFANSNSSWSPSTTNSLKAKIFHVKYWRDGELIRDMIPVRVGQVGYMYDKINNVLYGNDGLGEFGLGRDVYHDIRDYTRPDYVMSERSLLDTRFVGNGNTRVVLDEWHRLVPYNGDYYSILGARTGNKKTDFTFMQVNYAAATNYMLPADTYNTSQVYPGRTDLNLSRIIVDKNKGNTSIQSVYNTYINYSTTRTTASFSTKYPIYLGYFNENRTNYNTTTVGFAGSIYNFKVYDNDVQIREYIPAIHPDGTTGFFDYINETFHESNNTRAFRPGYNHESTNGNKFIFYNTGIDSSLNYVCNDSDLLSSLFPIKTRRIKIKKDPNYTTTVIEYGCRSIIKKGGQTIISSDSTGDTIEVSPDCNHIALLIEGAPFNYDPDVDVIDVGLPNYLCFTALENGTFTLTIGSTITVAQLQYIEYSIDNGQTWIKTDNKASTTITIKTPTITTGNKVLWRGIGQRTANNISNTTTQVSKFSSTGRFDVSGNIMSLFYGEDFYKRDETPTSDTPTFRALFYQAINLVHAHELCLPIFYLRNYSYESMFSGCTSLISTPKLHSVKLGIYCYQNMFRYCASLTQLPYLPAKYLAQHCYDQMFRNCTSIITIGNIMPSIANLVSTYAFSYMFADCTSLQDASGITINLLNQGYTCNGMFYGCTSLTIPPTITATSVTTNACQYMFANCTSLVTAPAISATSLGTYCYQHMYENCTSLENAPALPATALQNYCYCRMFNGCTSLVVSPELPSTSIPTYAYEMMFGNCSSLTTIPELKWFSVESYGCSGMFANCTQLTTTPELSALILGTYAYNAMFRNTGIIKAPVLSCSILPEGCYQHMFSGCKNLNFIQATAVDIDATNSLNGWTGNYIDSNYDDTQSGVSSTGIFIQRAGVTWPTGVSGIPTGWTAIYLNPEDGKYYTDSACTTEWNNSPTLPYTSKIEYLQNNGNKARIVTGLSNANMTKFEIGFYYENRINYAKFVSNYQSNNYNAILLDCSSVDDTIRVQFDTKHSGGVLSFTAEKQKKHILSIEKAVEVTLNGETTEITNTTNGTANGNLVMLFATNRTDTGVYASQRRIYYFKAWHNGTLVRNLVPVRIGETDGAMYDLASGTILENYAIPPATTPEPFTLGPDIT